MEIRGASGRECKLRMDTALHLSPRALGKGRVYYFTAPLTYESTMLVLDRIRRECGLADGVRVTDADTGRPAPAVEMRFARDRAGISIYVINLMGDRRHVRISAPGVSKRFFDLIANKPIGPDITLDRLETRIVKIE